MARYFSRRGESLPWWIYVVLFVTLVALVRYYQIESDVRNSPHHCSSPTLAREKSTLVGSPVLERREVELRGRRYVIREAWYEKTFSFFRTGPFTHRKVINDDELIFVAFAGLDLMKEQVFGSPLAFAIDGHPCELMLSDDCGLLIYPRDQGKPSHELVIRDRETTVAQIHIPAGIER